MNDPSKDNRYRPVSIIFTIIVTAAGVATLAGWLSGQTLLAGMAPGWIPMAPSTALLFLLCSSALLLRIFLNRIRGAWLAATLMVSACGAISLILFVLSSIGKHPAMEHLGLPISGAVGMAPLGHISPVTAFCFIIASLSYLASNSYSRISRRSAVVTWWLSFLLVAVNAVFLLAYLYGSPFLYGGEFIPPAVTTILAFMALGMALFSFSASNSPPLLTLNGTVKSSVRLLLFIFALLCCGIVVAGYLYYRHFEQAQRLDIEKRLSAIADLKVNELVLWRNERLGDADVIFGNPAFSSLVRRYFYDPGNRVSEEELKGWLGKLQSTYQYDRIYLLDNRNATRLALPPSGAPPDPHLSDYATQVLRSGKVIFTDFHRHAPKSPIHLSILVPVFDPAGGRHTLGVLVFWIDPGRYLYPFMERWPVPSMSGETLLVRREGDNVVFLNSLRFNKDAALTMKLPMSRKDLPAVNAVLGREDVVEGRDYRGVAVIAALRHVPDSPWYLVAKLDKEEIYAPLRERLWFVIALTATLLISVGTGVGLVWRQQSALFYKEKFRAEQKRAESEERYRELVQNANSAIIRWRRDGTITFFNEYAQAFFGYPGDEAIGRHVAMLLPDQEATGVDMPGLIKDIIEHSELYKSFEDENVCRDRRRVWMTWTNKPIFDKNGLLVEVLAVGNDITERKRAEAALREGDERLRFALETCHIGAWDLDLVDRTAYSSMEHARIFGYNEPLPHWTFELFLQHVMPEHRAMVDAIVRQSTAARIGWDFECRIRRADGQVRWIWAAGSPRTDVASGKRMMTGIVQDITGRKEAEKLVQRHVAVIQGINRIMNETLSCESVEELGQVCLGVAEEITGSRFGFIGEIGVDGMLHDLAISDPGWELCTMYDKTGHRRPPGDFRIHGLYGRVLIDGKTLLSNNPAGHADSIGVPEGHPPLTAFLGTPFRLGDRTVGMLGLANREGGYLPEDQEALDALAPVIMEALQRIRSEKALYLSEMRLRRAEEIARLGHWRISPDKNEVTWSDEIYRIFGVTRETYNPSLEWYEEFVHPDDRQSLVQYREALQREGRGNFDLRIIPQSGGLRHVAGYGEVEREAGKPVATFGTFQDVTELRMKEQELLEKNLELERLNYTISHDLKSPLVTVKTFLGYLAQDMARGDNARIEQDMSYMQAAAEKMGRLLEELFELSRLGKTSDPPVAVSFRELAQEAIDLVAGRISQRGAEVALSDAQVVLHGDRRRLLQIWQNLIDNAVKYMGDQTAPRIEVGIEQGYDEKTVFFVRDNGQGVDPRFREKIFGLFEQLDPRVEGTGIGLALVKKIVELNRGELWVESDGPGKGSAFFFTLPDATKNT